ncbi:amidohydrolase [Pseudanabaenaceae cyanobacterium LEGE 13415]|nr:amidohydrolase [Pseudanabaenaceae cyanobacterium LEGE 13415]
MSFTIQNVLIPTSEGYQTVNVQIQNDRILAVTSPCAQGSAPNLEVIGTAIDGTHKLLLPGFVNAHTHSSEMWQRGMIPPVPLELWLAELYEFAPLDPEQAYLSAVGTAIETLMTGGTSVVDHLVLIPGKEIETIAAANRGYREVGIRAFIAPLIQDEVMSAGLPTGGDEVSHGSYDRSTKETLNLVQEAVEQFHRPDEGVEILVAPTGIQLCSDALFEGCIELSDRYNLSRHAHLLETKAQKLLADEKYGCSAVQHLKDIGWLSEKTSLAHCVWLDEHDIKILAETRSTVVHNPLSNLRLGSGIAPILKYRQAGVNVAFGCDGSASNDSQDLLEAVKIGSILHSVTDPDYQHWITPRQSVEMAALGGATGLNRADQFGSLEVGKKADLVMYDLKSLSLLPRTDPIGLLVLGRPVNVVSHAWVNGKQVIADHEICNINVNDLKEKLFDQSEWTPKRKSIAVSETEARYRSVMGLSGNSIGYS